MVKSKHTIEYLGCSNEVLLIHITNKMVDGMTFDNTHIDHIKPVSRFDLDNEEEFMKCCHYSNLQPLFIIDNLEKHNKWTEEDELFWNENIIYKDYNEIYHSPK